jgi:hypothetical protein
MTIGIIGIMIYLIVASNGQALVHEAVYSGMVLSASLIIWIILKKATGVTIEKEETPVNSE